MGYFSLRSPNDDLSLFAWADNPQHAQRKVEQEVGPFAGGRAIIKPIRMEDVPEGAWVIDEPIMEEEARRDLEENR